MNRVWQHSEQAGSSLLVLLALADCADDEGTCYPGVAHLATKTRLSDKQVRRILKQLSTKTKELLHVEGTPHNRRQTFCITVKRKSSTGQDDQSPEERLTLQPTGQDDQSATGQDDQSPTGHLEPTRLDISDPPPTPPYKADPKTEIHSVANATGAGAPSATPKIEELASQSKAVSTEDFTVWKLGVTALLPVFSREEQARSFLGKAIRDFGKSEVAAAIVEVLAQTPLNPKEYLQKVLENRAANRTIPFDPAKRTRTPEEQRVFLAIQAVDLATTLDKQLTLEAAIARLRNPLERSKSLDGITEAEIEQVIKNFCPAYVSEEETPLSKVRRTA